MNSTPPQLSVVIPARNEEYFLPLCLEALGRSAQQLCQTKIEVIVVINRCTDRTEEIARAWGCEIVHDSSRNLSKIRNAGARKASGNVLVTLDADSLVSERMLSEITQKLSNPAVVGGGVAMLPDRWSLGIICTMLPLLFVALWYQISGGVFFVRAQDFWEIGGFDESLSSAEDIDFARRLRAFGKRTNRRFKTLFRAHIVTSCRKFDIFGDWFAWRHPIMVYRLFRGRDQESANKVWYEIERTTDDSQSDQE